MDIRQLKYFVAIVDAGSLSRAAQKLYIAQPSLSQQMAALEEELDTQLLLRSAKGVKPTIAGHTLYQRARTILRQMEQIRADVHEEGGIESGMVAVGLPTTIAAVLAVPLFEHVRRHYPGIRLQIFESMSGYISEMLPDGRLDLAILFRDSQTHGMSVIPVFDEELYVFGHAGLSLHKSATTCPLSALAHVPLVTPGTVNNLRLLIERTFLREEIELNIVGDIDSLPALMAIAYGGSACTILPASAILHRADNARPAMRRVVAPDMSRPASVCWSHALPVSAAALAVRKAMVGLIGELHASGHWPGITLRPPPDAATLHDTSGAHLRV